MKPMRSAIILLAALLAVPASAHHLQHVPVDAFSAPAALEGQPYSSANDDLSRTYSMSRATYAAISLRCELDVRYGPTADLEAAGPQPMTISTWSITDPVHHYGMQLARIDRVTVFQNGDEVRVIVRDASDALPIQTAQAN